MSCDVVVAVAGAAAKHTIFGKNSDRPPLECQPLFWAPRRAHAPGSTVRCQYLEIPQARETLAVLGGRPWWLWGFEHGVNEAGVAIGNTALHTRDEVPETGLLGMDLVRLALERAGTAAAAVDVITSLLHAHGQGGNARHDFQGSYHNSYVIADPAEAWVLESSARHWVAKRVRNAAAISNLSTIGDDWALCSDGIDAHARARGWWCAPAGVRLDFRAAFDDPTARPRAAGRYGRSCEYLAASAFSVETMKRHLRDHIDTGTVPHPASVARQSVCVHPGEIQAATAGSLVVELTGDGPPIAWCSVATPCTSVFLPIPVGTPLPEPLVTGDRTPAPESAWWRAKRVEEWVEEEPAARAPVVRRQWAVWEAELAERTAADPGGAAALLEARTAEFLRRSEELPSPLSV